MAILIYITFCAWNDWPAAVGPPCNTIIDRATISATLLYFKFIIIIVPNLPKNMLNCALAIGLNTASVMPVVVSIRNKSKSLVLILTGRLNIS